MRGVEQVGQTDERLLTIKEAAERLRVSEISLRRWTERGILPCLRIGGRRERRFREADIVAFLSGKAGGGIDPSQALATPVSLAGLAVARGRHLCALYDSSAGRDKLAVPFLREGLAQGERCFLIVDPATREEVLAALAPGAEQLAEIEAGGHLHCHQPDGDPMRTLVFFRAAFAAAAREGVSAMRVLGDMGAFILAGAAQDAIAGFEAEFERSLAHKYPVVSLCQYDARRFSGVAILRALEVHGDIENYPLRYFLGA